MWTRRARGALAAAGVALPLGCSLVEASVLDAASAGAPAATSDGGGVTPPRDDGAIDAAADGAAAVTDASACDPPEGGAPCDPGHVACAVVGDAEARCVARDEACCDDGANGPVCSAPDAGACAVSFASVVACDEASDCAPGEICVGSFGAASRLRTWCAPALPGGGTFQVCRARSECPLRNCVTQLCFTTVVESCGGVGDPSCAP